MCVDEYVNYFFVFWNRISKLLECSLKDSMDFPRIFTLIEFFHIYFFLVGFINPIQMVFDVEYYVILYMLCIRDK